MRQDTGDSSSDNHQKFTSCQLMVVKTGSHLLTFFLTLDLSLRIGLGESLIFSAPPCK